MLQKIFGINWGTTIAGIAALTAAIGRIALAYRTRDFEAILTDGQLIMQTLLALAVGLGLIAAKDKNVTGVGEQAKTVDSAGTVTNIEGQVVGKQ
jgi:hypothetical protein